MALLLRVVRRSLAPATALHRPRRSALFQPPFSAFSTTPVGVPEADDDSTKLTHAQRLALLPQTLKAFHARHGHFIMYYGYSIPGEDDSDVYPDVLPYPDAARGLELGTTLHRLLVNTTRRPKHVRAIEELEAIGFPVDVDWEQYVWERQRLPALRVYQEMYGDLLVPMSFAVPTGDKRWPIETWGFKLGRYAQNMKTRDHRTRPRKHLQDLDQLNASWNLKELTHAQRLALLVPTLQVFHAKYGHFLMPFQFVVPEDQDSDMTPANQEGAASDEVWPPKARGEKLGSTLHSFMKSQSQQDENPDVVQALAGIGFPVDVDWKDYVFDRQPLAAFRVYREFHGHCRVPILYVVPAGDTRWPAEAWGYKLGRYVDITRQRGDRFLTQKQREQLNELGFWWGRHGKRSEKV